MPAFAAVVGKDFNGSLTGATNAVTYTPNLIDANGVAVFSNDGAVYDANKRLSVSVKRPTKGSQVIRVQLKLVHPIMDATDTTLKVGECLVNLEAVFPKRATLAERELIMGHLVHIVNETDVSGVFTVLESFY